MKHSKSTFLIYLELGLAKFIIWIFQILPQRKAQKMAASIGGIFSDMVGIKKELARKNLTIAFPDRSKDWFDRTLRQMYQNMAMVVAETARIPKLKGDEFEKWVEVEGLENVDRVLERGKGCMVVSAHLGCWEYHGAYAANKGYPVTYVVAEQANPLLEKLIDDLRRTVGIEIIQRKDAAKGIVKALKQNRLLAIMMDQDARSNGVFVPFFGKPASTFKGVATFIIRMSASVLVLTSYRTPEGISQCKLQPVDYEFTGDYDTDILGLTTRITEMLEAEIRQAPEQWLWLHRRWKTKPKAIKN
ncbi:MAG: lysophospholipid acyltransferase family protein [Candidatus Electryonea clarkiae]|nr:lysophospholipid acyltransferase family protein [Candidatus Electryonea clarkiae]MDP8285164.1 lysophospholipid acyltransferase family protein [Candidatus Electryonea clarkiae]